MDGNDCQEEDCKDDYPDYYEEDIIRPPLRDKPPIKRSKNRKTRSTVVRNARQERTIERQHEFYRKSPLESTIKTLTQEKSHAHPMTKSTYRARIANADPTLVNDDAHVCHIIAAANGGANVMENYVLLNGALNLRLGNKGDHIMVYLVGLHKALAAVQASPDYQGPSASELYQQGSAFFRDQFGAQLRNDSTPERVAEAQALCIQDQ
jgi:hypothetical protein